MLRIEALRGTLRCDGAALMPHPPAWMRLPDTVS